jgi:amino acid adenylation domain-containing protein
MQCKTLIDLLQLRAEQQADKRAYTFMVDGKVEGKTFTYAELDLQARAIAAQLQQYNAHGERALLLYPQGLEFLAAFFGCLYAGVIAIPAPPPEASRLKRTLPRLQAIAKDAQAKFTLTTKSILSLVDQQRQQIPEFKAMHWLVTENIHADLATDWQRPNVQTDDLAYLQYTSGSTSTPKGVMISHHNLLHHSKNLGTAWKYDVAQSAITWMPYFHDYGLVDGIIQPLFANIPSYIMSPLAFIKRPLHWLNNISKYRITHTQAPNFAYQYCVDKIKHIDIEKLDLSSLLVASNGAESIHKETVEQFNKKFKPCGFNIGALYSAYGLAEATLLVSTTSTQTLLTQNNVISCGKPIGNTHLRIINPDTLTVCQSNQVGEIWLSDPSVAQGYWQNEQTTQETFQAYTADTNEGPFLRTGDLGFLHRNELFVTGRLKDLIIINGVNYYPQDIEWTVEQSHDLIRNSQSAAFSIAHNDIEKLVILVELEKKQVDTQAIIQTIRQTIFDYYELQVYAVVLLKKGSILKTSSGKIQRHGCKKAFLNNELDEIARDVLADEMNSIFIAPQSDMERQIAQIWANILQIPLEQIGIQDSFFKYGGQSLLAVEVINQINQYFSITLTAYSLFEYPTIDKLVSHIEQVTTKQTKKITPQKQGDYPLSYMQQQIWLACRQVPDTPLYNEPLFIHFNMPIDVNLLEKSIQFIVQRHTILRTVFKVKHGSPVQKVKHDTVLTLQVEDLQHNATAYQELAFSYIAKPFDLEKDLLIRAILFKFADNQYKLLFIAHHLVIDGLSIYQTFLQELHDCYHSFKHNEKPNLSILPIQYSDYAHWQQQISINPIQLAYWQQKLANIEILQLPTDYTANNTYQGAIYSFPLSKSLTKKLRRFGQQQDTTLFMNLLTIFYILLYRYTYQNDIAISTVINQRNLPELNHLIGLFLNTLILRTQFDENADFLTLLTQVKQVALEAYSHQTVPFSEIFKNLRITQKINDNPFKVAFVLEPAAVKVNENWSCSLLDVHTDTAKFDLTLQFEDKGDELIGRFEYRTDLFKSATIERMAKHFQTLLQNALHQPNTAIAKLPLLTEAEQKQFTLWNQTQADFPQDKCIHQLFEQQVECVPNNVAVVFEGHQLTYLELNNQANKLAHHLIYLGVQPEMLVGICINRSFEMVIGILAILKAGGAYVPLDPYYPPERLNFMVDDAQIAILLTQKTILPKLSTIPAHTTILTVEEWQQEYPTDNPQTAVQPNNLAYVIYTSGSTGKPKGVLLEHRGACNLSTFQIKHFNIQPNDTILQFSSLSFDAATWDIVMALMSGACLYIPKSNEVLVGKNLANVLAYNDISVATIPPSVLNTLSLKNIHLIKKIRILIIVGEKFSLDLATTWNKKNVCIINAYGPTESTICTTSSMCLESFGENITIGKPVFNLQVYILDKNKQPLPIGLAGELYIGGVGVARGYLNRPALTAEKFIPNPLTNDRNDRLYRTGDLVRFLEDGQLEFVGRIDNQVKIRGFRIELEEIASILKQHNDIQDAVVVIEQNEQSKQLVTYFVPEFSTRRIPFKENCQLIFDNGLSMTLSSENLSCYGLGLVGLPISCSCHENQPLVVQFNLPRQKFTVKCHVAWIKGHRMGVTFQHTDKALCDYIEQEIKHHYKDELHRNSATLLRQYLADRLPHYMVPSIFALLEKMPLTPNGKIDKKSLKKYECSRLNLQLSYTAPGNTLEQVIAEIWQQVLKLDKVGIHESFFDLGGDSLLTVKVQELLEVKLQQELSTTILFQYPTISVLAHYLSEQNPQLNLSPNQQHRATQRKIAHQHHKKHRKKH